MMRIPPRYLVASVVFVLAIALGGCGNKPTLVTVTGKVTHKGKAMTAGSVWFHPQDGGDPDRKEKMSGQLQLDGTFTARTFPHGEGIPPGKYKVTLSPDLAGRAGVPKYSDVTKTPWEVDVPETGLADHHFEVK